MLGRAREDVSSSEKLAVRKERDKHEDRVAAPRRKCRDHVAQVSPGSGKAPRGNAAQRPAGGGALHRDGDAG